MTITKTISAEFVTASIGANQVLGETTLFGGFRWSIGVKQNDGHLGAYVYSYPMNTTKNWSCSFSFFFTNSATDLKMDLDATFSNSASYTYRGKT
eukprot:sb/3479248/